MRSLTVNEYDQVSGGFIGVADPRREVITPTPRDYCGSGPFNVPDSPGGYGFGDACKIHDMLYSMMRDFGSTGKGFSDAVFLTKMLDWCDRNAPGDGVCRAYAYAYAAGVMMFGWSAFMLSKKDDSDEEGE